jgi:CelD/BcsL family acetyltransferase involved in cellulose biosynthesis
MSAREANAGIEEVLEPGGALIAEWGRLAERVAATPFLHPGFVLAWQRAFGSGLLTLATVRRAGDLVAALPFVRHGGAVAAPANWHTPQVGVLGEDNHSAKALAEVLDVVHPRRISLAFVDREDERTSALCAGIEQAGYRTLQRTLTHSPYLELDGDWDGFESNMGPDVRAGLRRRRRRLEERGKVSFEVQDGQSCLQQWFDEVVKVEAMGWKGSQATAIGSRPDTLDFYREIATWAAERNWLRIHFLRLEGRPLAVSFALRANGVHYGLKIGYDAEYRRFAPGLLLLHEIVRNAFAVGVRRVEMLGADEAYKRNWCPETRETVGLQAFAPSIPGRLDHFVYSRLRPLAARVRAARRLSRLGRRDGPRL